MTGPPSRFRRTRATSKPAVLEAISTRLRRTVTGAATAFEKAVCDASAHFGFVVQHVGGTYEPDGILDAPARPPRVPRDPRVQEHAAREVRQRAAARRVAKFRTSSQADFAVLVGEVTSCTDFMQEIQLHAISVWTVADTITALRNEIDAYECRDLFAPGFVTERLADLVWSRSHGEEKRELVVREILRREGYAAQCTLIGEVTPADAPVLSLDAAMLLVESALRHAGATSGATREEVHAAMEDLVRAREAVRIPDRDGIIIRRGL